MGWRRHNSRDRTAATRNTTPISTATAATEAIENRNTTAEIISQATPVARNNHQGPASCASVAGVRRGPN